MVSELEIAKHAADLARLRRLAAEDQMRTGAIERASMSLGDFDSAKRSRVRSGPRPAGGSADSHRDWWTLDAIRRDCQSLLRNEKLASSMVKRLCDFVVGDHIGIQVRSDDEKFNKAAEAFLAQWWACGVEHRASEGPDGRMHGRGGTQICRLAVRSAMGSGGVLAVLTNSGKVQLVEYERLRNPSQGTTNQTVINGVEYADAGAGPVVRYHIAEWSPTGTFAQGKTRAVDARNVLNLANPIDDEVNVTLPEPGLSRLVEDFSILRNYIKDTQLASTIATLFGIATKTDSPQDGSFLFPGRSVTTTLADGSTASQREVELEPAGVIHLGVNESIEQIKPEQPTTTFGDFVTNNLVMLGAEVGLPLVLWVLDMTKVNFASARSAVVIAYQTFDVWRGWLSRSAICPMTRWRLGLAIGRGELEAFGWSGGVPAGWDKIEALFPPMMVLDTLAQYQAEAYAVEKRLRTHKQVWMSLNGQDYDEGVKQIAKEQAMLRQLNISPVGQPGQFDPNIGRGKPESPTTGDEP